jgi:exopolyphosphatase/guanosine-5'-triphosphate,3'-diphosphate pyrophosphatase
VLGYDGHGEHSYYIIRHGNLRGFTGEEIEVVACAARFHGQRRPKKKVLVELGLGRKPRRVVRWLSALLQVAEGLDRSHYQLVRSLRVRRMRGGVTLLVQTRRDARLEMWAARRRTDLLERLIGGRVRVQSDPLARPARGSRRERRVGATPAPRLPATARAASGVATRPRLVALRPKATG